MSVPPATNSRRRRVSIAICMFVPFERVARYQKGMLQRSGKTWRPSGAEMLVSYIYLNLFEFLRELLTSRA
jgi:hypothetical protein